MVTKNSKQPRKPNGEYTFKAGSGSSGLTLERNEELAAGIDTPGVIAEGVAPAASTHNLRQWWTTAFLEGEYSQSGDVARMPDDWTPRMSKGRAISGYRRTHRVKYSVGDYDIRMPSRTAINSYMVKMGLETLDVPIGISQGEDNGSQMFVRVFRHPNGAFDVRTIGADGEQDIIAGESVAAILEGTSGQVSSFKELYKRRQARMEAAGFVMERNVRNSTFMESLDWNPRRRIISIVMNGKLYRYRGSKAIYTQLQNPAKRGKALSDLKKNYKLLGAHGRCHQCGRFMSDPHLCPVGEKRFYDTTSYVQRMEAMGRSLRGRNPMSIWARRNQGSNTGWTRSIMTTPVIDTFTKFDRGAMWFEGVGKENLAHLTHAMPDQDQKMNAQFLKVAHHPQVTVNGYITPPAYGHEGVRFTSFDIDSPNMARNLARFEIGLQRQTMWLNIARTLNIDPNQSVRLTPTPDNKVRVEFLEE